MTRVDLYSLLDRYKIVHPTRLSACTATNGQLRLDLNGWAWWKPEADRSEEGQIAFVFVRPTSGVINVELFSECGDVQSDEILDDFDISRIKEGDWSDHPNISIYGSAAMPNPTALIERLEKHLMAWNSYMRPENFLNGDKTKFSAITQTSAYLIAYAPGGVAEVICHELDRQGAPYYCHRGPRTHDNRFHIYWAGYSFKCEAAYAEFS